MKQATGSNAPRHVDKVSIQRSLDGHSFSVPALDDIAPGAERVEVEVVTAQTMLVPGELFVPEAAAELLAAAGLTCTEGQTAVWSRPARLDSETEAVAVMAIDENILQSIRERLGDRAEFTAPLLAGPTQGRPTLWLCHKASVLYIKVFDRSLRMAEAIRVPREADILYFVERLAGVFPLDRMTLHLADARTAELRKSIGKRFKQVVCES